MIQDAWRIIGERPLAGVVRPSGSKNGALPVLAAALLLDGASVLHNVPRIADVRTMVALLRALGAAVSERPDGAVEVLSNGPSSDRAPTDLVPRMRASHYLLSPMLLRLGRADMAWPGGCDLGTRPMTHIISVFEALGAKAEVSDRGIALSAQRLRGERRLRGGVVTLDPRHRKIGRAHV